MRKSWQVVFVLLLTVSLIAGCGGSKQEGKPSDRTGDTVAAAKDSIVIALQGEPTTLDPQFADDGNMRAVTDNVFERLIELDGRSLEPIYGLATEIKDVDSTTWS